MTIVTFSLCIVLVVYIAMLARSGCHVGKSLSFGVELHDLRCNTCSSCLVGCRQPAQPRSSGGHSTCLGGDTINVRARWHSTYRHGTSSAIIYITYKIHNVTSATSHDDRTAQPAASQSASQSAIQLLFVCTILIRARVT